MLKRWVVSAIQLCFEFNLIWLSRTNKFYATQSLQFKLVFYNSLAIDIERLETQYQLGRIFLLNATYTSLTSIINSAAFYSNNKHVLAKPLGVLFVHFSLILYNSSNSWYGYLYSVPFRMTHWTIFFSLVILIATVELFMDCSLIWFSYDTFDSFTTEGNLTELITFIFDIA